MFRLSKPKQPQCKRKRQSKIIVIGLIPFIFLTAQSVVFGQATYYVASTGNDSNNGTTIGTPFQSLTKVSSLALQAGDSVLFRRGDTFRGTLTIRRSGSASRAIVFDAYGSGPKPILSGSVPVTNWSNVGGNIWQAPCSSCGSAVTGLYRNGVALPLGRYPNTDAPNKGNLTIRAHTDRYQIVSKEPLPANSNWKGAEVVMRPTDWILDRAVVNTQSGDALNLIYDSNYQPRDNSDFFLQNHPSALDKNGEWCYDPVGKNVLIYDAVGAPANQLITATVYGRGVDIADASYVSLRNLHITQTLNTSLNGVNVSNLTLTNLDVTNAGEDGVIILGLGRNVVMENSRVTVINNNGIWFEPYQSVTLRGNTIRSIGIIPGRGKSGDGQYSGIQSKANENVLIEDNVIDSVGYNGITFGSNTTIRHNVIANYCYAKADGGGLYAWNGFKTAMSNIHILANILYTGPAGSNAWRDHAVGLFLDDCVENVEIRNNTIFGNTQWGVFFHATNNIIFTDNTLFDNSICQFVMYHNQGTCPVRSNVVRRNIFVSKEPSQLVAQYESNADDLFQYGQIDSNYYARPFNEKATIQGYINTYQGGRYDLKDWRTFSGGLDLNSKSSPITYKEYKNDGAGGTNRVTSTFDTDTNGWELLYSSQNNADVSQDNTGKLDGGSLRISFPNPSGQAGSYAQVVKRFGMITKGKTYVLRFDAIATTAVSVLVHLREYGPPYREYAERYRLTIGLIRTSYELPFTVTDTEPNTLILVQTDAEGPTFWLDNVRLQEDVPIRNNPNDFIKLFYNPTLRDSVVSLTGIYRDVKNQAYANSVLLKPFTSIILFRDTLPVSSADLRISMQTDKRVLRVNEATVFRLRVSNQSNTPAALARWTYRLPANLQFVDTNGQPYSDNVLTGTVYQLAPLADTTFTFLVKPTAAGLFRTAAQLTTATSPDPDSTPNSGTADGEDDVATAELRVGGAVANVFESPNPNQRPLPPVVSNQPAPNPAQADLSLRMAVSRRTPAVGEIITCTFYVYNAGGNTADGVQIRNELPDGLQLTNAGNWMADGHFLTVTLPPVPAGTTQSTSFQVRVTLPGRWINRAQINASNVGDPDSTPGNGFTNGEDDQAQTDVRTQ